MITISTLEEENTDGAPLFIFWPSQDEETGTESETIFDAGVCCLNVTVDISTLKSTVEKRWSEPREYPSDEESSYIVRVQFIGDVEISDEELDHAKSHGFEASALLLFHSLLAAYQGQYYGEHASEYCASHESDERWIRFFLKYLAVLEKANDNCGDIARANIASIREYADDLGLVL